MVDYKKCEKALTKFTTPYTRKKWVVGICVLGSYARKEMTENSDIDVYVLTRNAPYSALGSAMIDGVHIEYFIFPIETKEKQILSETGPSRLETGIFSGAIPLYDPTGAVERIIKKAQKQSKIKTNQKTKDQSLRFRYLMHECLHDARECTQNRPIAFNNLAGTIINTCIEAVYQKKRKYLPPAKKLDSDIRKIDNAFADLVEKFHSSTTPNGKLNSLEAITEHALSLYGAPVKEYEIRFKLS